MSANDATGETTVDQNSLTEELINRMSDLEDKYKENFKSKPLHKDLEEIIYSVASDQPIEPLKLCAIFSDYAEAFLDKATEYDDYKEQNTKLNNELFKANDLIRRLTDENEYHLNKLKFLAKQLEIYKDSWRGKLTEKAVERQITDLINEKDEEIDDLRKKLAESEREFMRYKFETNPNSQIQGRKSFGEEASKSFSELKGSDKKSFPMPRSMNPDQLYNELMEMEHMHLVEYCMDLKNKSRDRSRSKSNSKVRPASAVRSSQNCHAYKSLTESQKATENLDKKYKRLRKTCNELVNKNTIYQNDVAKGEKRIEALETRFNTLVEDFQKYINTKEKELTAKDNEIQNLKQRQQEDNFKEDQFHQISFDNEEKNTAMQIFGDLMNDYSVAHERDEAMLETIERYIYEENKPNIAYGIWEAADFAHCNNIEKSYKLMKALLQDCYIPHSNGRLNDNDHNSFSFKETQLKESYEKEKEKIASKVESLKAVIADKDHEIMELKDIIRLKNQEYGLLKQRHKEEQTEIMSNYHRQSAENLVIGSDMGSGKKMGYTEHSKSREYPIQPYSENRQPTGNKNRTEQVPRTKTPDNDGTVVIGGVSNMNMNTTEEKDVSIKNYKLEMSPIEVQERDASGVDDGILGVFDRTASNKHGKSSKRRLNFDENDQIDKENVSASAPEIDNIRGDKETFYKHKIDELNEELTQKERHIYELSTKLEHYQKSPGSRGYASPRFMEPENQKSERSKNQRNTAEKVLKVLIKTLESTLNIEDTLTDKFSSCINDNVKEQLKYELLSEDESHHIDNYEKDDEVKLLQTLINIHKISGKVSANIQNLYKLVETCNEPQATSDSQMEKERRLLHVKSDHELFLIKDITEEVSKILENTQNTKNEFTQLYASMVNNRHHKNRELASYDLSSDNMSQGENPKLERCSQLMKDMDDYVHSLEQLFHELIDRSSTIIDNSDLIEKNYIRLLKIANGQTDQKQKIDELHALNEENLRTILKLRRELTCIKKKESKTATIPPLHLDKVNSDGGRAQSVSAVDRHENINIENLQRSSNSTQNVDGFLTKKLQEADRKVERYEELLNEKHKINEALEHEISKKEEALRNIHSTMENTHEREYTDKKELTRELHKQRQEFQIQYDKLNEQFEHKRKECRELVNELNYKDQQLNEGYRSNDVDTYDYNRLRDENNRVTRELMISKDEANKYKLQLNQVYREVDSYKASLHSYEKHCEKLKRLNDDLNKALSDERDLNVRGRDMVQEQMMKMSSKVNALEGYSETIENTTRDYSKKNERLMNKLQELREHIASSDNYTSRMHKTPGTVRSNASGMYSSYSRNTIDINTNEDPVDMVTNDIRVRFDELTQKVHNYQNAINKLQGEKQQMYQSMNQFKVDRSLNFNTPATKAPSTTTKNNGFNSTKDSEKSETMIEYLRAEISHLREKNKSLSTEYEEFKNQSQEQLKSNKTLKNFMREVVRPAKDLIYQLCAEQPTSESYFYTESEYFQGMDPKLCLNLVKIMHEATDRIVDYKSILDEKAQIINELDRKLIELRVKFDQTSQMKHKQDQAASKEISMTFEELDRKCREFASNLKVLSGDLEKEKVKCERLENENRYLKDHIKQKTESDQNQELAQSNIESRIKIAREEGIRQGRREGIMDSKMNDYIEQYKKEIEQQGDKIVHLEEVKEKLELECNKLRREVETVKKQIVAERKLQQSLSKEIEGLTHEVKSLRQSQYDD